MLVILITYKDLWLAIDREISSQAPNVYFSRQARISWRIYDGRLGRNRGHENWLHRLVLDTPYWSLCTPNQSSSESSSTQMLSFLESKFWHKYIVLALDENVNLNRTKAWIKLPEFLEWECRTLLEFQYTVTISFKFHKTRWISM